MGDGRIIDESEHSVFELTPDAHEDTFGSSQVSVYIELLLEIFISCVQHLIQMEEPFQGPHPIVPQSGVSGMATNTVLFRAWIVKKILFGFIS